MLLPIMRSMMNTATHKTIAACAALVALASWGTAAEPPRATTPATQVWLVDTRCAPGCGDLEAGLAQINYWRLVDTNGCGQWQTSDAAGFQASGDPAVPTAVLIHGYGTDADWAVRHGNEIYGLMRQVACGRAFRLVVWSWPADREGRGIRGSRADVQMKVCRSDVDAYYLARLLSGLPRGEPLSLLGYSLGCRTLSGALQLLSGGAVGGRSLPAQSLDAWKNGGPRPIRAMLIAAAMNDDSLEPSATDGLAPLAVQRILVTENCRDRVLKWYSRLYGPHGPEALGRVGPAGPAGGKLEIVDVTCEVGPKHDFRLYEDAPAVCGRLGWYTFLTGDAAVVDDPRAGR
jgi:hypothetical protein